MAVPAVNIRNLTLQEIRELMVCPISGELLEDPVTENEGISNGHTFSRENIEYWLRYHETCPISRTHLVASSLTQNHQIGLACRFLDRSARLVPPDEYEMNAIYLGLEAFLQKSGRSPQDGPLHIDQETEKQLQEILDDCFVNPFKQGNNHTLTLKDGAILSLVGVTAAVVSSHFGVIFNPISQVSLKKFVLSNLSICLTGFLGREIYMKTFEAGQHNKKPLVRYTSLGLGVTIASLLQKNINMFRFIWEGTSFKQVAFRIALIAGSISIFDQFLLFPYYKNKVTQEKIEQSTIENCRSKLEDNIIIAKRYGADSNVKRAEDKIKSLILKVEDYRNHSAIRLISEACKFRLLDDEPVAIDKCFGLIRGG